VTRKSLLAFVQLLLWCALAGVVIFGAVNPTWGLLWDNPGMCAAAALLGLGLCMDARQRASAPQAHR
jgi:hypothetical protein